MVAFGDQSATLSGRASLPDGREVTMDRQATGLFAGIVVVGLGPALWVGAQLSRPLGPEPNRPRVTVTRPVTYPPTVPAAGFPSPTPPSGPDDQGVSGADPPGQGGGRPVPDQPEVLAGTSAPSGTAASTPGPIGASSARASPSGTAATTQPAGASDPSTDPAQSGSAEPVPTRTAPTQDPDGGESSPPVSPSVHSDEPADPSSGAERPG
ncbi:hypothetical protein [Plantactinospora sp. KBS50]|uniref:hypothetical protein n=1 Tax=Plantactinospora sp. KBS50 TaxID=2024580 RepID=UPI000BAAD3F8|nr:hypothetical protein [Plantactinospora sp. KBS50]ASW56175.1 hypothetical protein CIK06_21440 [Plantactinospora sp. KBS50]